MPKTMTLKARPGMTIPFPDNSYKYLTEKDGAVAVDVDEYSRLEYWTRRVDHGEADRAELPPAAEAPAGGSGGGSGGEIVIIKDARAPMASSPEANVVQPADGSKQEA